MRLSPGIKLFPGFIVTAAETAQKAMRRSLAANDEISRGLSMRSAEASKRTADPIDQTITKIREGVGISRETGTSIDEVADHVHKVTQLAAKAAAASGEQAKGLTQINTGVSEMEKVIQQNSAQSEQIASSTEALRSRAEEIMTSVQKLDQYMAIFPPVLPQCDGWCGLPLAVVSGLVALPAFI